MPVTPLSALSAPFRALALEAVAASNRAYAPYSRFCVGAALLHENGTSTTGANCENAIYQGCCAERSAIVAANAQGYRRATAVAVFGKPKGQAMDPKNTGVCTPCGMCRQMLYEVGSISDRDLDIILVTSGGHHAEVVKLSSLLPRPFGPKDLGLKLEEWNYGDAEVKPAAPKAVPAAKAAKAVPAKAAKAVPAAKKAMKESKSGGASTKRKAA